MFSYFRQIKSRIIKVNTIKLSGSGLKEYPTVHRCPLSRGQLNFQSVICE